MSQRLRFGRRSNNSAAFVRSRRQAAAASSVVDYRCVPSTSGSYNAAAVSRKRKFVMPDSDDSDGSDDERQARLVFDQQAADRRLYKDYELLCKERPMVIAFIDLSLNEQEMLLQLVTLLSPTFSICVKQEWDDTVTHLVVKTVRNNIYEHQSIMYMYALLSHGFIVSTQWIQECLNTGYLVPELDYMVKDKYGESTALNSWWSGRGVIKSPMEWTEECILFFYAINQSDETYINLIRWTIKAGFVIAQEMSDLLNERFRFRFVIASGLSNTPIPSTSTLKEWLYNYKAATLDIHWLLECLYSYRFVKINQRYQVLKLDEQMIEEHLDIGNFNLDY